MEYKIIADNLTVFVFQRFDNLLNYDISWDEYYEMLCSLQLSWWRSEHMHLYMRPEIQHGGAPVITAIDTITDITVCLSVCLCDHHSSA